MSTYTKTHKQAWVGVNPVLRLVNPDSAVLYNKHGLVKKKRYAEYRRRGFFFFHLFCLFVDQSLVCLYGVCHVFVSVQHVHSTF